VAAATPAPIYLVPAPIYFTKSPVEMSSFGSKQISRSGTHISSISIGHN